MKKNIFKYFIILILCINSRIYATEEILESQKQALGISTFIETAQEYINEEDISIKDIFSDAISGNIENSKLLKKIFSNIGKETKQVITNIGIVLIIIVINSILVSISESIGNNTVSKVAFFVEYLVIVTLVLNNFLDIINISKDTITKLVGFSNCLLPILMTLMLTTGAIVSTGVIKPIILLLINFIGNFIIDFILPITIIGTILSIISKISNRIKIEKLSKFMKTSGVWILGIIMTLFITILSLEGSITETVDGVTAKTAKAAVSTVIPVVGKILGDATDAVIGCAGILKNGVGFIGIVVIIAICINPIIKLSLLSLTYYLASCICQPIADEKIIGLLDNISDTFKILLAIICCLAVMFIVGISIVIKISNSTLLYR